jgi:hypothetical protein
MKLAKLIFEKILIFSYHFGTKYWKWLLGSFILIYLFFHEFINLWIYRIGGSILILIVYISFFICALSCIQSFFVQIVEWKKDDLEDSKSKLLNLFFTTIGIVFFSWMTYWFTFEFITTRSLIW